VGSAVSTSTAEEADAIVVGAGLSGSWLAKELTSGEMNVALIDAGPILPDSTFSIDGLQADVFNPRYHLFRLKLLLKGDTDRALNKFITSRTNKLFLDRRRDPYTTPKGRDFSWFRVRAVGGRGHLWGRVMLRFTDRQLSPPGFEWPIRYADLAPYYSEIEQLLEMGGAPSGTSEVPDGEYVHERTLHPLERKFRNAVERHWPLRRAVVNHVAGYEPAALSPMLKAALGTGRLQLFPNKTVAMLTTGQPGGRVNGVTTVCTTSGAVETFRAPFVILAASAFESVRILLNSRSDDFPDGVGNRNGLVGTRILEHMTASLVGQLPAGMIAQKPTYGHNPFKLNAEPHGFYMPPFAHLENRATGYRFGYGVQGTISTNTGLFYLGAFGETVPSDNNRLRLDETQKDRFGIPVASIDFSWAAEDLAIWKDADRVLAEMTEAFESDTGIRLQRPTASRVYNLLAVNAPVPGSNHECGGARMGHDPSSSVVDSYNRVWEAPNVLVCDAACFPSIPHQNPTLTTMALAVRAGRQLLADA
jgi:choline dehydrogenase-like flavoprotein